jgi:hypothetical protein
MGDNNLYNDELDKSFEKDLESAFILNERKSLESLFKNIEKQNKLDENEIERAFILNERKRLKEQFKEIENSKKLEVSAKISATHSKLEYESNWKLFLIAASIVGLIVTTCIWFLNYNNSASEKGVVKIETNKIEEENNLDSIRRKKIEQEYFAVLNNRESYTKLRTLDVRKLKQFGFGSNNVGKIKIVNYNLNKQIEDLEKFEKISLLDTDYLFKKIVKSKKDSLIDLKNKYIFDLNTLVTYNINSSDVEVYFFNDKYYLKAKSYYYTLSKSNTPVLLKKVNDNEITEQLNAL